MDVALQCTPGGNPNIYLLHKLLFHFCTQLLHLNGYNFFVSQFKNFWLELSLHYKTVWTLALKDRKTAIHNLQQKSDKMQFN